MLYSEYFKSKNPELDSKSKKFIKWIDQVEKIVYKKIGFGLLDLPDQMYMVYFEDGFTCQEIANEVLLDYMDFCQIYR